MYRCRDLTEVGSFIVFKNMSILSSSGATPFEVMLLPRWSTCWCPNAHLDIDSLWPAVWICLKTVSMFDNSLSTLCAAMPMSSTYWAHLLAFTIASTYSRTVLLREIGWVPVPVAGWRRFGPRSWTVVVALIARPPFEGNAMPASNSTQKSTSFLLYAGRRRWFLLDDYAGYSHFSGDGWFCAGLPRFEATHWICVGQMWTKSTCCMATSWWCRTLASMPVRRVGHLGGSWVLGGFLHTLDHHVSVSVWF